MKTLKVKQSSKLKKDRTMKLTGTTINTIQSLIIIVIDSCKKGHVTKGWVPVANMFNIDPLSYEEADEMNKQHDKRISEHLTIIKNLLAGEKVSGYLDSDF